MDELKIIKKKYGEEMMHYIRDNFSSILETPGKMLNLLTSHFNESHSLYKDLYNNGLRYNFKEFIYSLTDESKQEKIEKDLKSPKELLESVGYDLYECKSEEDIQKFKKYYAKGEELCTFNGGRLERCHVFFAVKKNVLDIKRENFPNPQRQDAYGTSILSIQFDRTVSHRLSIKNRYNHHVNNPDSTFSNNLDNIVEGLTASFAKYYGLKQEIKSSNFEIDGYVRARDGKFYKYNLEIDNVYYCPDNIIIKNDGNVKKYPKEKYLIFDYFILNLETKKIESYTSENDGFIPSLGKIKKITITNKKDYKELLIYNEDGFIITINLDKDNNIIMVDNSYVKEIKKNYLLYNQICQKIYLSNVKKISSNFMKANRDLEEIFLPKCETITDDFLHNNLKLKYLYFPNVTFIGNNFLTSNRIIEDISLPKCETIKNDFLYFNIDCKKLDMPMLETVEKNFMMYNKELETTNFPSLVSTDRNFLCSNIICKKINMPKLESIGKNFMSDNKCLEVISLPSLKYICEHFLYNIEEIKILYLPDVYYIFGNILGCSKVETAILPNLISISYPQFFEITKYLYAPKLEKVSDISFLKNIPYCYTPLLKEFCNTEDIILESNQIKLKRCK